MNTPVIEGRRAPAIDPRIRERLVAIRREESRRRLRLLLAGAAVVVTAAAAWGITRSPLLAVHRVRLAGAGHTTTQDAARAAGLAHRRQMIDLDEGAIARAVSTLPWVATAGVSRQWPSTVAITVTERHPVAIIAEGVQWALVDESGRLLAVVGARPPGLPEARLVSAPAPSTPPSGGSDPAALTAPAGADVGPDWSTDLAVAADLVAPLGGEVVAVVAAPDGQVQLELAGGATALLGPPVDLADKLTALATMLTKVKVGKGTVDVRVPAAPVLTAPKSGQ